MRFALVHLLAVRPLSDQDIHHKTHIPKAQLASLLPKIADKQGLTWELSSKPYKELDPWSFKYTSDQRTLAINHAIRAFDRARIPKDDKVWQNLLPKEERNKGKILSRLHLTAERSDQAGTPGLDSTPLHTSAAATPKLGGTGTPRAGSGATATGRSAAGISIEKRLKEAKKKGAMDKKKHEKEAKEAAAAASDRESKPRNVTARRPIPPKKVASKVKSDEVVHSSDDEEEGEVKEDSTLKTNIIAKKEPPKPAPKARPVAIERRDSSASEAPAPYKDNKTKSKLSTSDKLVASAATRKDSAISKISFACKDRCPSEETRKCRSSKHRHKIEEQSSPETGQTCLDEHQPTKADRHETQGPLTSGYESSKERIWSCRKANQATVQAINNCQRYYQVCQTCTCS
jgi:RNA polymerase II elongation factor ELL